MAVRHAGKQIVLSVVWQERLLESGRDAISEMGEKAINEVGKGAVSEVLKLPRRLRLNA